MKYIKIKLNTKAKMREVIQKQRDVVDQLAYDLVHGQPITDDVFFKKMKVEIDKVLKLVALYKATYPDDWSSDHQPKIHPSTIKTDEEYYENIY